MNHCNYNVAWFKRTVCHCSHWWRHPMKCLAKHFIYMFNSNTIRIPAVPAQPHTRTTAISGEPTAPSTVSSPPLPYVEEIPIQPCDLPPTYDEIHPPPYERTITVGGYAKIFYQHCANRHVALLDIIFRIISNHYTVVTPYLLHP